MAQLGIPDMKAAIAYALSFPERLALGQALPDFSGSGGLTFQEPDFTKFPCLELALDAGRRGGTLPTVLNASNEVAVHAFLEKRIAFNVIPKIVGQTMAAHDAVSHPTLAAIIEADRWARHVARKLSSGSGFCIST
jgi:1-deoxy-D-xylulose-5-phosphate reductoisomerase